MKIRISNRTHRNQTSQMMTYSSKESKMQTAVNGSVVKFNRPELWLDDKTVKNTFHWLGKGWKIPKIAYKLGVNETTVRNAIVVNSDPHWRDKVLNREISLTAAADTIRGWNHNSYRNFDGGTKEHQMPNTLESFLKEAQNELRTKATDEEIEKFLDVAEAFGGTGDLTATQFHKIAELLNLELVKK